MLRNKFRMAVGIIILVVFAIAVVQWVRTTSQYGQGHVGGAVVAGLEFLLFLALVLWFAYLYDRRMKRRQQ